MFDRNIKVLQGNVRIAFDEDGLPHAGSNSRSQRKDGQIWLCNNKIMRAPNSVTQSQKADDPLRKKNLQRVSRRADPSNVKIIQNQEKDTYLNRKTSKGHEHWVHQKETQMVLYLFRSKRCKLKWRREEPFLTAQMWQESILSPKLSVGKVVGKHVASAVAGGVERNRFTEGLLAMAANVKRSWSFTREPTSGNLSYRYTCTSVNSRTHGRSLWHCLW